MRPRWVEVSQQPRVPFLDGGGVASFLSFGTLCCDVVGDHQLRGEFGIAVGVRRAQGALFRDGDHARHTGGIAVDSGGRRVDDVGDVVGGGRAQEVECACDIDTVVVQRDLTGLSHGFEGREVDDAVDVWVFLKDMVECFLFGDVQAVVVGSFAADELDAVEDFGG